MANKETFHGYGPEQGYAFLREKIADYDFARRGVSIAADEIFVSDGAKSDMGNIGDIFCTDNIVAVTDPVYPVYVDTNTMSGRQIKYIPCTEKTGFCPEVPDFKADIIYLCSPNNPTGATMTKQQLEDWVAYARKNGSVILFDAAYEAYITDPALPHSIFEIEGAKECAIEFRSFSKTAGFTGLRCGFAVVPKELMLTAKDGKKVSANSLWNRRHTTKFNGTPYIVQRAAEAVYSAEGRKQINENIAFYRQNACAIKAGLDELGYKYIGGENSPYIWLKCPGGLSSWEFFDLLLNKANVVGTPGAGFGQCGEGWFRLTAFGNKEDTAEAVKRLQALKV